jgi:hypothetical protein
VVPQGCAACRQVEHAGARLVAGTSVQAALCRCRYCCTHPLASPTQRRADIRFGPCKQGAAGPGTGPRAPPATASIG